jgi:TonB-linked SusC/RagA family outer membrane protein
MFKNLNIANYMNKRSTRQLLMLSKHALYGLCIQALLASILIAGDGIAQQVKLGDMIVSVTFQEERLENVFTKIEYLSGLNFAYHKGQILRGHKISGEFHEKSLESILLYISWQTDLKFKRIDGNVFVSIKEAEDMPVVEVQQGITITGKVTSIEEPTGLPGVNILIKGTKSGTVSDLNGNYQIEVPESQSVLIFSSVGYATEEIEVGNRTVINLSLTLDITSMAEIVVIGYGEMKKSDITGSVASFNTEALKERPQTNILQALQGTVAGVNVTTTSSSAEDNATLLIRGQNSITASNNPLIILDGIPYSGRLSELNPNDIASMEVLKDASSTAIYGSRGANGVILISTKAGKAGKLQVGYNTYYSFDEIAHLPDMQNAGDFWRDSWERSIINPLSRPTNTLSLRQQIDEAFVGNESSNTNLEAFMMGYPGMTWEQLKNDILSKYPEYVNDYATLQQVAADFAYPAGGRNTNWVDLATRVGHRQHHNLSFSGGNEHSRYYVSSNYGKTEGIALGDVFQRMVNRINLNLRLIEGINYGTNTQFGFYDRSGSKALWGGINSNGAFLLSPTYKAHNEDGSINLYPIKEETHIKNPLEPLLFDNEDKEMVLITNHYIDVVIPWVKGLHYKLNTGYTWNNARNRTYKGQNTTEGKVDNGILSTYDGNGNTWIIENIFSYNRSFGRHNLFLTGLYSAQENLSGSNRINGRGFANDVMTYYQASQAEILTAFSSYTKSNYISQMFRANYGFDERYLFTGTIRRDGYSAFGRTTKFGIFPSVALGWNIANENLMATVRNLDVLKLRLSYGINGNEAVGPYSTLPILSNRNYIDENGNILYGYFPMALENTDLSWETTKSFNVGVDFSILRGRIHGVIDAYRSNTYDLLLNETISAINGTTSITRNIGETKNHGVELQLSSINVHRNKFSWKTDFNFATYNSKIVHVGLRDGEGNYINDVASQWFIGHPVNVNFDYALDRILQKEDFILDANGNYLLDANNNYQLREEVKSEIVVFGTPFPGKPIVKDFNGDGIIGGSEDKMIHGNLAPDFISGMTNTFKYGNFTFSFFLNGVWGITKRNDLINTKGLGPKRKMNLTYWTQNNPISVLPGINAGSLTQEELYPYFDANYVRLQDISLTYDLPSSLLSKLLFSDFAAFINIKNMATYTKWKGLDPEYTTQSDVPRARSYILGLRFTL